MDKQKKRKQNIIGFSILGGIILIYAIWIGFRMNKWQSHLNSPGRIITNAFVYDYYEVGKNNNEYFEYVYKVGNDYYFESTSGENVNKVQLKNGEIERFIVVVSKEDPTIHCILWNRKPKSDVKLGAKLDLNVDEETIKDFTVRIGLSPRAKIDKDKEKSIKQILSE